jgi:hypothetical protein
LCDSLPNGVVLRSERVNAVFVTICQKLTPGAMIALNSLVDPLLEDHDPPANPPLLSSSFRER